MKGIPQVVLSCLLAAVTVSCGEKSTPNEKEDTVDLKATLSILRDSKDPAQLEAAAVSLCKAKAAEALRNLVPILRDAKFLQRLDSEQDYEDHEDQLRIRSVLQAMGRSPSSQAVQALEEISEDKGFIGDLARLEALIDACGLLEKPSPKLLTFLDSQAQPGGVMTNRVTGTLARIGSAEACQLIEKRLLSKDYDQSFKVSCFTEDLIEYRNRPGVVGLYKRFLRSDALGPKLREIVVLTLFDYRRLEWYKTAHNAPVAPPRGDASTGVLTEVLECADLALKLDVPQEVKERVKVARKEIEDILAGRKAQKEPATPQPKSEERPKAQ